MAKLKNPLLSLNARGTLGNVATYSRKPSTNIVRQKPIPLQPHTLPQTYQRWNYRDGIYYWRTLSSAQKQVWKSTGARFHMPGFAYFMKDYLTTLPDLTALWHLDYIRGATTPDSSKQGNTGTVFGALIDTGVISHCLKFDGLDDYVEIPRGNIDAFDELTLEVWLNRTVHSDEGGIIADHGGAAPARSFSLIEGSAANPTRLNFSLASGANFEAHNVNTLENGVFLHLAATFKKNDRVKMLKNGAVVYDQPTALGTLNDVTDSLYLGRYITLYFEGLLDEVRIWNRVLTNAQILEHSERRWP